MAPIFSKTDGERIPASGRRAPNIFSNTENSFFFIFHPSYIINKVLHRKMSANEIEEKCLNLFKTSKNEAIYHIMLQFAITLLCLKSGLACVVIFGESPDFLVRFSFAK